MITREQSHNYSKLCIDFSEWLDTRDITNVTLPRDTKGHHDTQFVYKKRLSKR